jgi:hypothetical protein
LVGRLEGCCTRQQERSEYDRTFISRSSEKEHTRIEEAQLRLIVVQEHPVRRIEELPYKQDEPLFLETALLSKATGSGRRRPSLRSGKERREDEKRTDCIDTFLSNKRDPETHLEMADAIRD